MGIEEIAKNAGSIEEAQAMLRQYMGPVIEQMMEAEMVSRITDKVLPFVKEWQNRPLEDFYSIIWLDAIHFKIRDNHKVENKGVYVVIGISKQGKKEVLGLYVGENESASFWQSVVNNISNRGVKDVCIACIDGLAGFGKVTKNRSVFPTVKSLEKLLYLATKNIEEKWSSKVQNWGQILGQFDAFFPEKVKKYMEF